MLRTNGMNTYSHIHNVSPSLCAGQHGGHTGSSSVMCVHVNGYIWETVSQSTNQKLARLWLQQAGHILEIEKDRGGDKRGKGQKDSRKAFMTSGMIQYFLMIPLSSFTIFFPLKFLQPGIPGLCID